MSERHRPAGHGRFPTSRPYYERTNYRSDEDRQYGRRGAERSPSGDWGTSDPAVTPWNERFDQRGRESQFSGSRNRVYPDYEASPEESRYLQGNHGADAGFTSYGGGRSEDLPGGRYYDGTQSVWEPPRTSEEEQYGRSSSYGASFRGRGPKGYERSDERLREIVCERLTDDPRIDASDVTVDVANKVVKLTGTVSDRRTKYEIEDLVERCGGVSDIDNQLRVSR